MKLLKELKNHKAAFEDVRKINRHGSDSAPGYFDYFLFICRLWELEPKSVYTFPAWQMRETFPWLDQKYDGVFTAALYPMRENDFNDDKIGNCPVEWLVLHADMMLVRDKADACGWCGITKRNLERWMTGDDIRPALPHFRIGMDRIFLESDLFNYMNEFFVGEPIKHFHEYIPGDDRPLPSKKRKR
jgi:hypothetical protein